MHHTQKLSIAAEHVGVRYDLRLTEDRTFRRSAAEMLRLRRSRRPTSFWALQDVTFQLRPGEILGVVGANGSGKSTLLLTIAGILRPDVGTIETFGQRSTLLTIGAGFERDLTGRANIYLNAAYLGFTRRKTSERIEDIISFSGLGEFIDAPLRTYSTGMRTRLAFSIAAHIEPEILLLDEILGVGDISFQEKSKAKIQELIDGASAIVVVTHNMEFVRQSCTLALWLEQGQVVNIGEPGRLAEQYVARAVKAQGSLRRVS